jgi:hypothetical protein
VLHPQHWEFVQGDKEAYQQYGRDITVADFKINKQYEALVLVKYEHTTEVF